MAALLFALIVAAITCGILWRRPDARAFAGGAWEAGKAQAVREFRDGYAFAQERLRRGDPSWRNPRRWLSWALAGAYGAGKTVAAANRIRREAWQAGTKRYREWQDAQPIDGEVVEDVETTPQPDYAEPPLPASVNCPRCGALVRATIPADGDGVWATCTCGHRVRFFRQPLDDPPDEPDTPAERTSPADTQTPDPDSGPETHQEEPEVQTEAAGLTSYAAAHSDLAAELQSRMSGIENLAASMRSVLAEHSDLIGNSAVMQDLLNQAAGVAQQTAARALEVANN